MFRRLVSIAFGLALLLCVATVVLWVRSYSVVDAICYRHAVARHVDAVYRISMLSSCEGGVCVYTSRGVRALTGRSWRASAEPPM